MLSTRIRFNNYNYDFIPKKTQKRLLLLTQKPHVGKHEGGGGWKITVSCEAILWLGYSCLSGIGLICTWIGQVDAFLSL